VSDDFAEVRYADADGVSIAYCIRGNGPIDLVRMPGILTSIRASTVDPVVAAHDQHLSGFSRLIWVDRRGLGMSDPLVAGSAPPLEQQVDDILAVMDAVGSRQAALYGSADGGQVALLFAAMHPTRVKALVLNYTSARVYRAPDYPFGLDPVDPEQLASVTRSRWGDVDDPYGYEWLAPSRLDDPTFRHVLARLEQESASRAAAVAAVAGRAEIDLRAALPLVQAPTLVLLAEQDLETRGSSQFLVDHIPNARLATFPGADRYLGVHTPEIGALIEEFLTGTRPVPVSERILATVLFTDIVGSTRQLATLGDQAWRAVLDRHDAMVRTQLDVFRGRAVNTTGDGFLATFDGPARAVRCAQAIRDGARALGIDVRAGVHVGECETRGDDLAGIAVHIGARVCALARPAEVLVTSTVKDLVAGSGINFTDRGVQALKGIPDRWRVFTAEA